MISDNYQFMDVEDAAKKWGISSGQVRKYCREARIPGLLKNGGKYTMPVNSIKPPSLNDLKKVLVLTLQLKNKPNTEIDFAALGVSPNTLPIVYKYLEQMMYIHDISSYASDRLPYEAVLTERGIELATSNKKILNASLPELINIWGPALINIAASIIKINAA